MADPAQSGPALTDPVAFHALVEAEADGRATDAQIAALEADRVRWQDVVEDLLDEVEDGLVSVRSLAGPERAQVVADFEAERTALLAAFRRAAGLPPEAETDLDLDEDAGADGPAANDGVARLQLSWSAGRLVAWAAGAGAAPLDRAGLSDLLDAVAAGSPPWAPHASVPVPTGPAAAALAVPVGDILGWLAAVGDRPDTQLGASVRWFSAVTVWAVELVARGSMVPLLKQKRKRRGSADKTRLVHVRWTPALVDANRLAGFARAMPGSVRAVASSAEARDVTTLVLTAMVDAICRQAAQMVVVAAPPPAVNRPAEVAEAFLTRLDGSEFTAPPTVAGDVAGQIDRWAKPVVNPSTRQIVVQLDPPDSGGAWHLKVLAPGPDRRLVSVDVALVNAGSKRRELEADLGRLERLLPELNRLGSHRRGDVILSQDEAWQLMSVTGRALIGAGFDVRVPAMSPRKLTPTLRLDSDPSTPSSSGAGQLSQVRWSVLFDDVELTAAEIAALAAEARPLVRSGGRWVAVEHADLEAAAAALEERAGDDTLTGAQMLRYALGLEGTPLAGGINVQGASWATDLLRQASQVSTEPAPAPEGFVGELRSYQREALAWLGFLDSVGLGGCLALDMGLGKTPTMLAHLLRTAKDGPTLVIAPPAVVTNWAGEARKFTPDLRVVVHHGASRSSSTELAAEVEAADVIITTYGTAVRDVEALGAIEWSQIVLDEAQVIKNPTSETAQLLRRIPARTRVALTGTPIENGLGDLWAILDFTNPGLVGQRSAFVTHLSTDRDATRQEGEDAMRALNGVLVFRRTKDEPVIAAELPDRIDEIDHCSMSAEQIGLYQAVIDQLLLKADGAESTKGHVFAAITALKQICNHPSSYTGDADALAGRSGKLARLEEIVEAVYAAGERVVVFTQYAEWGQRLAAHLTARTKTPVECYHGGLTRTARDQIIENFETGDGPAALVLSLKAGGTGLNLTAANHVVLYDRWWNPAVEDQARDRAWRLGQTRTVIYHQLICPGTIDERVDEVVAGKRRIADVALPRSSSVEDLDPDQLRRALGLRVDELVDDVATPDGDGTAGGEEDAA